MITFENPTVLFLIPAAFILLMVIIFRHQRKDRERNRLRVIVFITRFLIFSLLIVLIAAPYTSDIKTIEGDTSVNVLVDKSDSMELFKYNEDKLKDLPLDNVNLIDIGKDTSSPIGDAILNTLNAGDNVLLLSDGNVNEGTSLQGVIQLADSFNTTVNALSMDKSDADASIHIQGPSMTLSDQKNEFYVLVDTSQPISYEATLKKDGQVVKKFSGTKSQTKKIPLSLKGGNHKLTATLDVNDHFKNNNEFYKSVETLEKPKILYLSKKNSPIDQIFNEYYNVDKKQTLPSDLNPYLSIITNDIPSDVLDKNITRLTDYVVEGNGLFTIGGEHSYDKGGYKKSQFQSLLPVKVGSPIQDEVEDLNVIIVIDISISSGFETGGGSVVEIEKSLARNIFSQLALKDNVGVIAFNNEAHVVSELQKLENQPYTPEEISKLQYTGGTYLQTALNKADNMLQNATGNKNVVVISDGKTKNPKKVISIARELRSKGVQTHSVGVGSKSDTEYLNSLALEGGGNAYSANAANKLSLMFDKERDEEKEEWKMTITDDQHFITKGLTINGKVSGYNQVVPRTSARELVMTESNIPILSSWRFGLGRVAALSTDGGNKWNADMIGGENSQLITRTTNWVVGDPRRDNAQTIEVGESFLNQPTEVSVKADSRPNIEEIGFEEVDVDLYKGAFTPDQKGFFKLGGKQFGVNYPPEYKDVGYNENLNNLINMTGGKIINIDETEKIINKIKKDSRENIEMRNYKRILLASLIIAIFLLEILIRQIYFRRRENKKI